LVTVFFSLAPFWIEERSAPRPGPANRRDVGGRCETDCGERERERERSKEEKEEKGTDRAGWHS